MPSQLLHVLHGLAVLEALEKSRSRLCAVRGPSLLPSFCLGCQGPDIFYHNQRTRPVGLEYGSLVLNMQGAPWIHPCEGVGVSHASVQELFDSAVHNAAKALVCAWEMKGAENLSACIGNASLSTNDAQGRRCLPRHFTPLPMDMLLDAQAAAWREGNLDT